LRVKSSIQKNCQREFFTQYQTPSELANARLEANEFWRMTGH
jgi:hypothetical protein